MNLAKFRGIKDLAIQDPFQSFTAAADSLNLDLSCEVGIADWKLIIKRTRQPGVLFRPDLSCQVVLADSKLIMKRTKTRRPGVLLALYRDIYVYQVFIHKWRIFARQSGSRECTCREHHR